MKNRLVIVGAGAGGASAAAEARRKNPGLSIELIERCGNVSTAS